MGLTHRSSVFFGTFVPRESKVGKRLHRLFDARDGQTSVENVEVGMCGSASGGPRFMTVYIAGVNLSFDKDREIQAPRPLPNATGWAERIGLFLAAEGIDVKDVIAQVRLGDLYRVYAVADDGTETPLPTYEEALARLAQIDAALAGAFTIAAGNNNQPRVFIAGAGVELVRHRRALADMRLPDNVADAEAILASAVTALQTALREEPFHPSRMTGDLQTYPRGDALNVVPELADEVDEHRATKEKLAEADKYIAAQDAQIEALDASLSKALGGAADRGPQDKVAALGARIAYWIEAFSSAQATLAALRADVDAAIEWHRTPGGMRPNYPPDLAGCPPSALATLRRMLGGAK